MQQILHEWHALLRAKGYGRSFRQWVLAWDFVTYMPVDWPSASWMHDLVQLLEFDCEALAAHEVKLRRDTFAFKVQADEDDNCLRMGFSHVRGDGKPPLTCVQDTLSAEVRVISRNCRHEVQFETSGPSPMPSFKLGHPVRFGTAEGLVADVTSERVTVAFNDAVSASGGSLHQTFHRCTADELHAGFHAFWAEFWCRDSAEEARDLQSWPGFLQLLHRMGPAWAQVPVDVTSLEAWRRVLSRASPKRATGPCGFAVGELKALPDTALLHLSRLFAAAYETGLPDFLLFGRVCVLAKTDFPTSFTHGRPITVLSAILRLWCSLLSTQLLKAWSALLPASVVGGVPFRSARNLTLVLQFQMEMAKRQKESMSGFTLDLVKFFNLVPRPPALELLVRLGCPRNLAAFWIDSLFSIRRFSVFLGDESCASQATTGVPEGDALSVAVAVAISFMFAHLLQDFVRPVAFVDNWSWITDDPQLHVLGMAETCAVASALRLQVDWSKSFAWSVSDDGMMWWKQHGSDILPAGVPLVILPDARDLGAAMRYRHMGRLCFFRQRLDTGMVRLQRLALQPRPIHTKARLVQSSVWPACFYAAEAHAVGLTHIRRLRGTAARAMVGPHRALSPLLALVALSPHVQDPECYLLTQALRALRRLFHTNLEVAEAFLVAAMESSGHASWATGPASALKALLTRNGWTLHADGLCTGLGNVRFSVRTASASDIASAVNVAWAYFVRQAVQHRNGLARAGVPCGAQTSRVLRMFPVSQSSVCLHAIPLVPSSLGPFATTGLSMIVWPVRGAMSRTPRSTGFCSARRWNQSGIATLLPCRF